MTVTVPVRAPVIPATTPIVPPPSYDRIKLILSQDPPLIDVAKGLIEKFNLPYIIDVLPDGKALLKHKDSSGELFLSQYITLDPASLLMKEDARKCAVSKYEVLIQGETGTGKEILAKSMIAARTGSIKVINCGAMPEQLIESELFGHEKGSFTGADSQKMGLMSAAKDGVMFFDEIGELPLHVQAKLLRAIQEMSIRKVGSNKDESINCKLVFATKQNLGTMVKEGKFREDLFARISTLSLKTLPLSQRKCDLVPITESMDGGMKFLEKHKGDLENGRLDISLNVRSLWQHVVRFNVLGRVVLS